MRCGRVLDWTLLGPICRPSNRRSEIRNAGAEAKFNLKERSDSNAYCHFINKHIVISRIFSGRSRSRSSKGQGHLPGTPTMFPQFFDFEGGGVVGGQPGESTLIGWLGPSRSRLFSARLAPRSLYECQRVRTGHFCGSITGKNVSDRPPAGRCLR